jgi:hypothetical protein
MAGWKLWAWAVLMAVPPDKAAAVMVQTVKDKALSKLFIVSHPLPGFLAPESWRSSNIASDFKWLQGEPAVLNAAESRLHRKTVLEVR